MKEFGSDFHALADYQLKQVQATGFPNDFRLFGNGRQSILALLKLYGWKRIWMPEYFCYNIIEYLQKNAEIKVAFYTDYPGNDDRGGVTDLPFMDGDVLFRMNYFGLRSYRSTKDIPVPVIEDHSHDLIGDWARNSDADWCIASLRKIIPIPEGGILWSPKGYSMATNPIPTAFNEELARKRWLAMEEKSRDLNGENVDKESFRKLYLETEDTFDEMGVSSVDEKSKQYYESFDLDGWNVAKKRNWEILSNLDSIRGVQVVFPESPELVPFSLVLLFDNEDERERVRKRLIGSSVYPAVLWHVPSISHDAVKDFSKRMLSLHCDGRYGDEDIKVLYNKINTIICND